MYNSNVRRLFQRAATLFFCAATLGTFAVAHAATFTWDGGGGDTNATTVTNWAGDASNFAAGDTIIFDSGSGTGAVVINSTFATSGLNFYVASNFAGSGITISSSSIEFASSTYADSDTTLTLGSNTAKYTANFVWTAGTLSAGSGTLDFNGTVRIDGGTVTLGNATAASNVNLGGTFTHAAGTTLTFDGSSDQVFTTASSTLVGLTINNSGSTSTIEVSTSGNLRVATLTLTDGLLDIGTNNSTLYVTGDISAHDTNGSFSNTGTGSMVWIGTGIQLIDSQAGDVASGIISWGPCLFSGGGIFQPTSGSTIRCGSLKADQGTFNPRTNNVAVSLFNGDLTITNGATYSSSTATLTISGTAAKVITDNTVNQLGSKQDLGFVVISNTGGISTATSTRFTSFVINSGATLDVSADTILTASSTPFVNSGTLTDSSTSGWQFVGSLAQTIPARVYNGDMAISSNVAYTVSASTTVVGNFTKSSGSLSLGSSQLHVTGTYANSGGTVSEGTGRIRNTVQSVKLTNSSGTEVANFSANGDIVYIRVAEADANLNASAIETIMVNLTSAGVIGETETVTLYETGVASGVFMYGLPFRSNTSFTPNDGILQFNAGGTLKLVFVDMQDSSNDIANDTATFDGESIKSITYPPTAGLFINGEDKETKKVDVWLYIPVNGSVANVLISNDPNFTGSTWEPYDLYKKWKLKSGPGKKTVYIKVEAYSGLQSTAVIDTITLAAEDAETSTSTTTPLIIPPKDPAPVETKKPEKTEPTTPAPSSSDTMATYSCPERSSATSVDNGYFVRHITKEKSVVGKRTITKNVIRYYLVLDEASVLCPVKDIKTIKTWSKKTPKAVKEIPDDYTLSSPLPEKPKQSKKSSAFNAALKKFQTAIRPAPKKASRTRLGLQ